MSISWTCLMIGLLSSYLQEGEATTFVATPGDRVFTATPDVGVEIKEVLGGKRQETDSSELEMQRIRSVLNSKVEALLDARLREATEKVEKLRLRLAKAESALAAQKESRNAIVEKQVAELLSNENAAELKVFAIGVGEAKLGIDVRPVESAGAHPSRDRIAMAKELTPATSDSPNVAELRGKLSEEARSAPELDAPEAVRDGAASPASSDLIKRASQLKLKIENSLDFPYIEGMTSEVRQGNRKAGYRFAKKELDDLRADRDLLAALFAESRQSSSLELKALTDIRDLKEDELSYLIELHDKKSIDLRVVIAAKIAMRKLNSEIDLKRATLEGEEQRSIRLDKMLDGIQVQLDKLKKEVVDVPPPEIRR